MAKAKTPIPIHTLITHTGFHPDEARAFWKLYRFGQTDFPGVDKAIRNNKIILVPTGTKMYQGKDWRQLEAEGILMVGVGFGRFDDHEEHGQPKARQGCASKLISDYLGIGHKPELKQIDGYVFANDTEGKGMPTDLASQMKIWHRAGISTMEILERCFRMFDEYLVDEMSYYIPALAAFKDGQRHSITLPDGSVLNVIVVQSDNETVMRVVRNESKKNGGPSVLIQRYSTGNTYVAAVEAANLDLRFVAARLRSYELRAKGQKISSSIELYLPGVMPEVPEWYFFVNEKGVSLSLMNGSPTNQETPPSNLALKDILRAVTEGLLAASENGTEVIQVNKNWPKIA